MSLLYQVYSCVCVYISVTQMLASHMSDEFDEEGLTAEEMDLAREMLNENIQNAERGTDH